MDVSQAEGYEEDDHHLNLPEHDLDWLQLQFWPDNDFCADDSPQGMTDQGTNFPGSASADLHPPPQVRRPLQASLTGLGSTPHGLLGRGSVFEENLLSEGATQKLDRVNCQVGVCVGRGWAG